MDDLIYLVQQTYMTDDIGQQVPQETLVPVFARIQSLTRSEWMQAGEKGLQGAYVAITAFVNYSGETIVQMGTGDSAQRYAVYRTYHAYDSDEVELYLEKKVGV